MSTPTVHVILSNYLALGQFELARALLLYLAQRDASSTLRLLEGLISHGVPETWMRSAQVPSSAHLSILLLQEYKSLLALAPPDFKSEITFQTQDLLECKLLLQTARFDLQSLHSETDLNAFRELDMFFSMHIEQSKPKIDCQSFLSEDALSLIHLICSTKPLLGSVLCTRIIEICPSTKIDIAKMYVAVIRAQLAKEDEDWSHACYFLRFLIRFDESDEAHSEHDKEKMMAVSRDVDMILEDLAHALSVPPPPILSPSASSNNLQQLDEKERELEEEQEEKRREKEQSELQAIRMCIYESLLASMSSKDGGSSLLSRFSQFEQSLAGAIDGLTLLRSTISSSLVPSSSSSSLSASSVSRTESKKKEAWIVFMRQQRAKQEHFLETALNEGIALIRARKFASFSQILQCFPSLAPFLLLLGWDLLQDDIISRQSLLDACSPSLYSASASSILSSSSSSKSTPNHDPNLVFACDSLAYATRLAWWASEQIMLQSHVKEEYVRLSDLLSALENPGERGFKLAIIFLKAFEEHSLLYTLHPWITHLDSHTTVSMIRAKPTRSPKQLDDKNKEEMVLRGFLCLHDLLTIVQSSCTAASPESEAEQNDTIKASIAELQTHLSNIQPAPLRLVVLESIFSLLFLRKSHLKLSAAQSQNDNVFAVNSVLASLMLDLLDKSVGHLREEVLSASPSSTTLLQSRYAELKQRIEEAKWRHGIVTTVLARPTPQLSAQQPDFLQVMLSSPATLMSMNLKKSEFSATRAIFDFFSSRPSPGSLSDRLKRAPVHELEVSEVLQRIKSARSIQDAVSIVESVHEPHILVDMVLSTTFAHPFPSLLIKKARSLLQSSSGHGLDRTASQLEVLLSEFEGHSLADILSSFHEPRLRFQKGESLTYFLSARRTKLRSLSLLMQATQPSSNNIDGMQIVADILESKSLMVIQPKKEHNDALQYVNRILEYLHNVATTLQGTPLSEKNPLVHIQRPLSETITSLAHTHQAYDKAATLAKAANVSLERLLLHSAAVSSKDQSPSGSISLETVSYLSTHSSPLLACLSSLLLSHPASWLQKLSAFAFDTAKQENMPHLHRWIEQRSKALLQLPRAFAKSSSPLPASSNIKQMQDFAASLSFDQTQLDISRLFEFGSENGDHTFLQRFVEYLLSVDDVEQAFEFAFQPEICLLLPDSIFSELADRVKDSSSCWKCIHRIKDVLTAASLVLKHLESWDADQSIDILSKCESRLPQSEPLAIAVSSKLKQLLVFREIQQSDARILSWQWISSTAQSNLSSLVTRLVDSKRYELARQLVDLFSFAASSDELRVFIEKKYVLYLVVERGGAEGQGEAVQALVKLGSDAVDVCEHVLAHVSDYHNKLFIIRFMLSTHHRSFMKKEMIAHCEARERGYKVLSLLPSSLEARFSHLQAKPAIILEHLLMLQEIRLVGRLLKQVPGLCDDEILVCYAEKSLAFPPPPRLVSSGPSGISQIAAVAAASSSSSPSESSPAMPTAPPPSPHGSNQAKNSSPQLQPPPSPSSSAAKKLPSSSSSSSSVVPVIPPSPSKKSFPPLAMPPTSSSSLSKNADNNNNNNNDKSDGSLGSSDHSEADDQQIREEFKYPQAPNIILTKAILDLCASPTRAGRACLKLCERLSSLLATHPKESHNRIITLIQQILQYAKLLFLRDPEGHGNEQLPICDTLLSHIELLQMLLYHDIGFAVSLSDLSTQSKAKLIRDRLISADQLQLAVNVATRCRIESEPVWMKWGLALLRLGQYETARDKFKYCTLNPTQRGLLLNQILQILEGPPPIGSLAPPSSKAASQQSGKGPSKSRASPALDHDVDLLDDIIDISPHPETPRGRSETPSRLDPERLQESLYYIRTFGSDQALVAFLLRNGRIHESVQFAVDHRMTAAFFVENIAIFAINHGQLPIVHDSLALIDPALGIPSSAPASPSSAAKTNPAAIQLVQEYLLGLCKYLTQKKSFRLLYETQCLMHDDVRAGLTCIHIFLHSWKADAEQRMKHLDSARKHFLEGMGQGQLPGGVKPVLTQSETAKYIKLVALQQEVTRTLGKDNADLTLFDSWKKKCEIAELLLPINFDLSFRIMHEFRLPATKVYARAAALMARKRQTSSINDLLKNMKGTVNDEDSDEIIGALIHVLATEIGDVSQAEKLIPKLVADSSKVRACCVCKKHRAAYLIAAKNNNLVDVQFIRVEALRDGSSAARAAVELCDRFLAQQQSAKQ